ncbi:MAG: uracil phosphoribosyltransferase [Verrucomicrobia bacterium]|nr:uracil phosphoribosyltransferase [Verrucomicrobiota bacterium]
MKHWLLILTLVVATLQAQVRNERTELHHLVYAIRDPETGPQEFRHSLKKIGEYLALEVLQNCPKKEVEVRTLTNAPASHVICDDKPILVTIMRAGLPLLYGVQKIFPDSETGFLGTMRDEETLKPHTTYIALPELKNKPVIIVDTMLATGGSILEAIKIIEERGPSQITVICAIAAQPGLERIKAHNPSIQVYAAATDPILNEKGYIVPGLGDAGDRSYGQKQ